MPGTDSHSEDQGRAGKANYFYYFFSQLCISRLAFLSVAYVCAALQNYVNTAISPMTYGYLGMQFVDVEA